MTNEAAECGCSCGCHNVHGYRGCRNKAEWLPEYKVWACKECLVVCDE